MFEFFSTEVGLLRNLNYLICSDRQCAVVDPAFEVDRLLREVAKRDWNLVFVFLTHTHPDHVEGVDAVVRATRAKVYVGAGELARVPSESGAAELMPLVGGERIALGRGEVEAIATPGHTVAGVSYLAGEALFTGDTLFVGGCGRTDFPGGDPRVLWRSLQTLSSLPEETRVHPGHDYGATPTSTIGWERTTNPYLLCQNEEEFVALRTGKSAPRPTRGPR